MMRYATLIAAAAAAGLAGTALGANALPVDPTTTITATMDNGTNKTGTPAKFSGATWYETGLNPAAPLTGIPSGTTVPGTTDALSTYTIGGPAQGPNVLMLDAATKTATITFAAPVPVASALSFAGSTGNGSGTITPTLNFVGGGSDTIPTFTLGDWFDNTPIVYNASGRIDVGSNSFTNVGNPSVGNKTDNPRIVAGNVTLPAADAGKAIQSISLSWVPTDVTKTNAHTMLFGVSVDPTGTGHFTAVPLAPSSFNQDGVVGLAEVPEPASLGLLAVASLGLLARRRRA